MRKAIIVGASSGIGRALARVLADNGYELGLVARRRELLLQLQHELAHHSWIRQIDVRDTAAARESLGDLLTEMNDVDLVVISAGVGELNPDLIFENELASIETNVCGFTAFANVVFHYFLKKGKGHLLGISSIAAIRGNSAAPAYSASKAYISNYLEGLRQKADKSGLDITVTEIQPGFVDTEMAKGEGLFWVTPVNKAASKIYQVIQKKTSHAYVTKRWQLIAWLLKLMPRTIYHRL